MPNCANEPESDNPLLGKGWNEVLAVAATSGKLCHLRHSGTSMDCLAQTTMAQSSPNAEPRSGSIQKQKAESRSPKLEFGDRHGLGAKDPPGWAQSQIACLRSF